MIRTSLGTSSKPKSQDGGQKWNGNDQHVRPKTLVETLDHANPQFYPVVYVVLVTLLTYPVSTCTAERSFCADDEAKNSSLKYHE